MNQNNENVPTNHTSGLQNSSVNDLENIGDSNSPKFPAEKLFLNDNLLDKSNPDSNSVDKVILNSHSPVNLSLPFETEQKPASDSVPDEQKNLDEVKDEVISSKEVDELVENIDKTTFNCSDKLLTEIQNEVLSSTDRKHTSTTDTTYRNTDSSSSGPSNNVVESTQDENNYLKCNSQDNFKSTCSERALEDICHISNSDTTIVGHKTCVTNSNINSSIQSEDDKLIVPENIKQAPINAVEESSGNVYSSEFKSELTDAASSKHECSVLDSSQSEALNLSSDLNGNKRLPEIESSTSSCILNSDSSSYDATINSNCESSNTFLTSNSAPTIENNDNIDNSSDLQKPTFSVNGKPGMAEEAPSMHQAASGESKAEPSKDSAKSLFVTELDRKETGFPDAFEGSVVIGKYISVKGDFTLRSTEALIESPSLVAPYLLKEPDKFPVRDQEIKTEPRGFFQTLAGGFLIGVGLSRVKEWYHKDMVRMKCRQMKKEGTAEHLELELQSHQNHYAQAKKANECFEFPMKICKICNFVTESSLVLEGHLLEPHLTSRKEFQCSFCLYLHRDPGNMLSHIKRNHGKMGHIQPPLHSYECPYCTFESNSKAKFNTHLNKCVKYFDRGINQTPPRDFEFPCLTPKPITVAVVKAYEKSITTANRARGRPRKPDGLPDTFQHHLNQLSNNKPFPVNDNVRRPLPNMCDGLGMQSQLIHTTPGAQIRGSNANFSPNVTVMPNHASNQLFPGSMASTPGSGSPYMPYFTNKSGQKVKSISSPFQNNFTSPDTTPIQQLPKLQGPYPSPLNKSQTSTDSHLYSNSLVVCEICDGYIKDLEQLRTHMQLMHKVRLNPKMLVSRPPLNCQKCQWRFFTDQGLERHLLGAHGLVTSNMQDMAGKGKDAGCCTICGRVYASKLVAHMNQIHKVALKPAHLSYKCTVCSATFNLYRLFENHVYLVHSSGTKRPCDSIDSGPLQKLSKLTDSENIKSPDDLSQGKATDESSGQMECTSEKENSEMA